jgi:hypothetical protein
MIGILATLAFQTMANRRAREQQEVKQPFQLNRCHALSTSGPVVAKYYSRWSIKDK